MNSAQFRDDIASSGGVIALSIAIVSVVVAAIYPGITVVLTSLVLLVDLWLVYLVYRLVVAVEEIAHP